ncbi:MAG: AraC family transcriptional regulator [Eubacteriales bacterium]|nr:AraC family transcriptional regulator [Eubacteriales bacterium]
MTVETIQELLNAKLLNKASLNNTAKCGYVCDLLSWVMAKAQSGCVWVTVQTHMNVVAVASLKEMSCIVLPEDIIMPEEPLKKAEEENIPVLSSPLSAYEICARLNLQGLPPC